MNRRTLIATIGAVTAGGAAIGTGAFTSVEAERTVNVAIAEEDTALLALEPAEGGSNSVAARVDTTERNQLSLDFNGDLNEDALGPGTNSVYEFDGVFEVRNQGAQDVFLEANFSNSGLEGIDFYVESAVDNPIDGDTAVAEIGKGNSATIGVTFDTNGIDVERGENERSLEQPDVTITASDELDDDDVTVVQEDGSTSGPDV